VLLISLLPFAGMAQRKKKQKKKEDMTLIDKTANSSLTTIEDTTAVAKKDPYIVAYEAGLKLIDSANYKGAISEFKKSTKLKQDHYESWLKLGYCKMMLKDYASADKDYVKAQETGPNDFETMKLIGINFFLWGNYPEAKVYLDSALYLYNEEKIEDAEYHLYRAKLMFKGKSLKTAKDECAIAMDLKKNYYEAMILKCEVLFAQKEWAYALRELNETIKALPEKQKNYDLYKMRAKTKFELKDYKGSVQDWSVYIDANTKDEEAYISRAMGRINMNDHTNAIVDLDEAIKINPKNCVSYCYRGLAKGCNKQIVEGIKDLDYSIKLKFDYSTAYVNRASLKMAAKDKRGACDDLQKADSLGNEMAPGLYEQYCKQ
jgi:tetratricopeptide (TPR) repeat protein